MHHPRWKKGGYSDDWDNVHEILKSAGNVSAVFAGHTHSLRYAGQRDGIAYYQIGTTGGVIGEEKRKAGSVDHIAMVTVRGEWFKLSVLPVGKMIALEPKEFSNESLLARKWYVKSPQTRTIEFKVNVKKTPNIEEWLNVGIGHGADDTGDNGMHFFMIDPKGKMIDRKFLWQEGIIRFEYKIKESGEYTIKLHDKDTRFDGRHPGNGGSLEVVHKKRILTN